jgi:hypothetical protein
MTGSVLVREDVARLISSGASAGDPGIGLTIHPITLDRML